MTNRADPDQLASSEANRSGFTLFAKTGHVMFSKRRVKYLGKYDKLTGCFKPQFCLSLATFISEIILFCFFFKLLPLSEQIQQMTN